MLPFKETKFEDKFIRLFSESTNNEELSWHRDREFRIVEIVSPGGWKFQFDNETPILLKEGDVIDIPALEWHRAIKGHGPLVVAIEKLTLEEAKKRKINKIISEALDELFEGKISDKTRKALKNKAEKSNAPLGALTAVYKKGLAAWLADHKKGTNQHQWAMARVNSFLKGGKARNVDKKEWTMVQKHRNE